MIGLDSIIPEKNLDIHKRNESNPELLEMDYTIWKNEYNHWILLSIHSAFLSYSCLEPTPSCDLLSVPI